MPTRMVAALMLLGCSTDSTNKDAKSFVVTVSGEDLAHDGYGWTKGKNAQGDPPQLVDGWAVTFDHWIITVARIRLNEDPDKDSQDPTVLGPTIVTDPGTFAVDVVRGGPIVGKSGSPDEKTVEITRLPGDKLDPARRYAFSYDLVAATPMATLVNLDAAGKALYARAQTRGWSMAIEGTATYKGDPAMMGTVFAKMPASVHFSIGLENPSSYINCRNTDLMPAMGELPRGVQPDDRKPITIQITMHTDHLFWDQLNVERTPLHFDPFAIAAREFGGDAGVLDVTSAEIGTLDVTGFKTSANEALLWRSLCPDYSAPRGQMSYRTNGTTLTPVNSFLSYVSYSAASGGHMNADGECTIKNAF